MGDDCGTDRSHLPGHAYLPGEWTPDQVRGHGGNDAGGLVSIFGSVPLKQRAHPGGFAVDPTPPVKPWDGGVSAG